MNAHFEKELHFETIVLTCVVTPSMLDINKGGSSSPPANKELDLSTGATTLGPLPLDKLL